MIAVPRKKGSISQTRSLLYGLARFLGDVQAVSKGAKSHGQESRS
jgi:hypothetical protein